MINDIFFRDSGTHLSILFSGVVCKCLHKQDEVSDLYTCLYVNYYSCEVKNDERVYFDSNVKRK